LDLSFYFLCLISLGVRLSTLPLAFLRFVEDFILCRSISRNHRPFRPLSLHRRTSSSSYYLVYPCRFFPLPASSSSSSTSIRFFTHSPVLSLRIVSYSSSRLTSSPFFLSSCSFFVHFSRILRFFLSSSIRAPGTLAFFYFRSI
jgi:hypothetical protein